MESFFSGIMEAEAEGRLRASGDIRYPDGRFWINGVAFEDTEPWMRPVTQRSAERIEMGDRVTAWLRRGEDLGSVWGVVAVVRP